MQLHLLGVEFLAPCVRSPFARAPFIVAPDYRIDLAPAPYGASAGGIEHTGRSVGEAPAPLKRKRARKGARKDGVTPTMVGGLAFLRRCNRFLGRWIDRAADVDGKRRAAVWARWLAGTGATVLGADTWGPDEGAIEHRRPQPASARAARLWEGLTAVALRSCRTEADAAEAPSLLFEQLSADKGIAFPIAYVASAARRHERVKERQAQARRAARDAVAAGWLAAASDPRHAALVSRAERELGDLLRTEAHARDRGDGDGESARTARRKRARLLADLERRARAILADSAV